MESRKDLSNAKQPNSAVDNESANVDVETIPPGLSGASPFIFYPIIKVFPPYTTKPMTVVRTEEMTGDGGCDAQNGIVRKDNARDGQMTAAPGGRVLLFESSGTGPTLQNDEMSADINEMLPPEIEMSVNSLVPYGPGRCSRSVPLRTMRMFNTLNTLAGIEDKLVSIAKKLELSSEKLRTFNEGYEVELVDLALKVNKTAAKDREQIAADAVAAANKASAAKAKGKTPEKPFDGPTRAEGYQEKGKEVGCCAYLGHFRKNK